MINLIPTKSTIALIVVVFLAGVMISAYLLGSYNRGIKEEQQDIRDSLDILRTRGKIRGEINADDARALCKRYGLSGDEERECMRCVGEPDTKDGDGCIYDPK